MNMNSNKTKKRRRGFLYFTIVIILISLISASLFNLYPKVAYPVKYSEYVEPISQQYELDKYLIYAIINTESRFKPDAQSDVGARGLMQLMENAFDWVKYRMGDKSDISYDDMYDPESNIRYGAFMMKLLLEEYNDTATAVAAYHGGRGMVNKWLKNPEYSKDGKTLDVIPSKTTGHYVYKVMKSYKGYSKYYN